MSSVYEPREDSELLSRFVKEHARGRVLDMGTGSGVQAFTALRNPDVTEVFAVDVNPLAVEYVRERLLRELTPDEQRRITVLHGDMFSAIPNERFDTIVCNPPYLPQEDDADPALYGGQEGYEWSVRFLREAKAHLHPDGQILFLFSSLTNRDRIDLELKRMGYQHDELGMLAMFFERLYVYRIWVHP